MSSNFSQLYFGFIFFFLLPLPRFFNSDFVHGIPLTDLSYCDIVFLRLNLVTYRAVDNVAVARHAPLDVFGRMKESVVEELRGRVQPK